MPNTFRVWRAARVLFASAILAAAAVWAVPAFGQETQPSQPARPQEQTPSPPATEAPRPQPAAEPAAQPQPVAQPQPATQPAPEAQPVAAPAEPEPLFREFKGVTLGMSAEEARAKLGSPQERDKVQDFFVLSPTERARVYYDDKGRVSALIVTFVGKSAAAPEAKAVLGSEIEANPDGSAYKMIAYPRAGYWVAYSRTAGDEPLTIITMQRAQSPNR